MTDEYIARERALSLAHTDATRDRISWDAILKTADGYLAFLMPPALRINQVRITPEAIRIWKDANAVLAGLDGSESAS